MSELNWAPLAAHHIGALEMIRFHKLAHIPREVCHPVALAYLRRRQLIEESGIPGFWVLTPEGEAVDLEAASAALSVPKRKNVIYNPMEPSPEDQRLLVKAAYEMDRLMPGDELFGKTIRHSTLDFLEGKSLYKKFVWFAYPQGFLLKHIAWALREIGERPLWTEHNVTCARERLGLPANRMKYRPREIIEKSIADEDLRQQLIAEGTEPWEVDEYFALRDGGGGVH